ncbi:monovalent cation/H+ antiporter complex subunit F [Puerhibacterium sp. TATVAM-FAB25]|uniref:monovalent cation/H+ antiporter complex subunit F n=1 Tax=Puerhibacterium sp. TATVAM-FAB25 TaxID=3093699 RepID=UPI003978B2CD
MIVAVFVTTALLAVAALLAVVRIERGPSMLDRSIAFDVLTSVLVGAIAVEAAWSRRTETIPILVVLSLVGFVGSVTIARFASVEPEGEASVPSSEEIAADEADRLEALDTAEASHDAEHHGGGAEGEVR